MRLLKIVLLSAILSTGAYAQNEDTKNWKPVLDNAKCAASLVLEIGTLVSAGIIHTVATISDVGASILEGKICFQANKNMSQETKRMFVNMYEMGCIAPLDDIKNHDYYSYTDIEEATVNLFSCK